MRSMLAVVALAPSLLFAQQPPPAATEVGIAQLALTDVPAKSTTKLTVTSPAFSPGGDIPFENTQYRGNVFPGLAWTAGPAALIAAMKDHVLASGEVIGLGQAPPPSE